MREFTYSYPYEEKNSVKIKTKKQLFDTFLNYPWESKFLEMDDEEREFSSDKVPFCEGASFFSGEDQEVEVRQDDTNQYQALELPTLKLDIHGMRARVRILRGAGTEAVLEDNAAKSFSYVVKLPEAVPNSGLQLYIQKYGYGPYGFSVTLQGAMEELANYGFFSNTFVPKFSGQWFRYGISREHILVILNSLVIGDLRGLGSMHHDYDLINGGDNSYWRDHGANNPWSESADNKKSIVEVLDYMAKRFEKEALTNYGVFLEMLGSMSPYFNKYKDADKWVHASKSLPWTQWHRYPYKSEDDEIYEEMYLEPLEEKRVEGASAKIEKIEEEMQEQSIRFLKKILKEDIKELTNKIGFDAEGKNYNGRYIPSTKFSVPVLALRLLRKKLKKNIITSEEFKNIGNNFINRKDISTELRGKFKKEFKDLLIEKGDESILGDLISDFTSGETNREDSYKILKNYKKEKVGEELENRELYDEAEDWYSHNRMTKKATEVRKKKADMAAPKTEINIDDRDTIIKDSVVNKSNIATGGKSKAEELREAKARLDEGIIDDAEFKQMKKEILGK